MKISTKTDTKLVLDDNEVATLAKILILIRQTPNADPSFARIKNSLSNKQKDFLKELSDSMRHISTSR
jgi:hypothetical protein